MKIPAYARYEYTIIRTCDFLEEYNISQFPIDPFKIIELENWGIITYSELSKRFQCTINDTIISLGSKDALTIYDDDNYTIAYNDTQPKKRILFTLLHEIGHIYLNHLIDFEHTKLYRGSLTKAENKVLENEANTFARNVLAPATFIKQLKDRSKKSISRYFGISYPAAKTRLELLDYDYQHIESTGIKLRLYRLFHIYYNRYGCVNCKAITVIKKPAYCPICGKKKLKWGDGEMIYNDGFQLDENGRVIICPRCDNEEIEYGDYCKICHTYLINRCSNIDGYGDRDDWKPACGEIADGNARYCIHCGEETTFFKDGLLDHWEVAQNRILNIGAFEAEVASSMEESEPILDNDDDWPPF